MSLYRTPTASDSRPDYLRAYAEEHQWRVKGEWAIRAEMERRLAAYQATHHPVPTECRAQSIKRGTVPLGDQIPGRSRRAALCPWPKPPWWDRFARRNITGKPRGGLGRPT